MSHTSELASLLKRLENPQLKQIDLSLERMKRFMAALCNPERSLPPVIHVAGTNGKGSLVAFLQAIFKAAGLRVHRYTSPHLVRFNERIVLNHQPISDAALMPLLREIETLGQSHPVTFFESTTAAAFLAFSREPADVVLLETGLGGRLDATNILEKPRLCAITPISIDHAEYLGNSIGKIAGEKAAILKNGVTGVIGPQTSVALEVINFHGAISPLYRHGAEWNLCEREYRSPIRKLDIPPPSLPGEHQYKNAATAIACIDCLPEFGITETHLNEGITRADWPGRLQRLTRGPLVELLPPDAELWLDGGHNPGAGEVLARWIDSKREKPVVVICGMVKKKDIQGFISNFSSRISVLYPVAIANEPLGEDPYVIHRISKELLPTALPMEIEAAISDALQQIGTNLSILIAGSLYLAGKVLEENT